MGEHNIIVVFMIPAFDPSTGYLPPGIHPAVWADVPLRFATNSHRVKLTHGLLHALINLADAGCRSVLVDGSYVTNKALPGDYDATYESRGINPAILDPVLRDFSNKRAAMKAKYLGELFPATMPAEPGVLFREFFLKDRSGVAKGIVQVDLGSLP